MMKCRWWDSNPHGFPNDFESFASAIPPHRLIFNFETFVPVSEDWRDVQEGCKKSCFDKPSKFNAHSWISRTDKKNHEADFESPSSAIPTHRRIILWATFIIPDLTGKIKREFLRKMQHKTKRYTPVYVSFCTRRKNNFAKTAIKQPEYADFWKNNRARHCFASVDETEKGGV